MPTATSRRGWRLALAGAGLVLLASAFGNAVLATGRAGAAASASPASVVAASGLASTAPPTTAPPTTAPPATAAGPAIPTSTVAPLSTLPVTPTTQPLITKPQSAHVSGVFVVLSISGVGLVVLMMIVQLFLTRAGRERRGARTL